MAHLSPASSQTPWPSGQPGLPNVPVVTPTPGGPSGFDLLADVRGNTQLHCGPNSDFLAFRDGSGVDRVFNFDPSNSGDVIAISRNINGSGITSVEQIRVMDNAAGAVIDLGAGNGICLVGVPSSQLDASDFFIG